MSLARNNLDTINSYSFLYMTTETNQMSVLTRNFFVPLKNTGNTQPIDLPLETGRLDTQICSPAQDNLFYYQNGFLSKDIPSYSWWQGQNLCLSMDQKDFFWRSSHCSIERYRNWFALGKIVGKVVQRSQGEKIQ